MMTFERHRNKFSRFNVENKKYYQSYTKIKLNKTRKLNLIFINVIEIFKKIRCI